MGKPTRWQTDTSPGHTQWYIERFRRMASDGTDLGGEARLLDAMVAPGSRILDAGSGTGRVAAELAARGHHVVGVDADPALVEAARLDYPAPEFVVADLAELDLSTMDPFDAAVVAGNVMVFLAPGSEKDVLTRLAAHVRPEGPIVIGFATDREYPLDAFDADAAAAGLRLDDRFATWDLRPWRDGADFVVTVLRRPMEGS
jgi:SAM-dependent methyltransferase